MQEQATDIRAPRVGPGAGPSMGTRSIAAMAGRLSHRPFRWVLATMMTLLLATQPTGDLAGQEGGSSSEGRIIGQVISAQTAQPLASVQVQVEGTDRGTLTDAGGRFILSGVPARSHSISAQTLGFARKTVTDVVVAPNAATSIDISLEEEAVALEGITVSAERERGSTSVLLDMQRTSVAFLDAAGAQEIARSPDSNAAQVARRLSGTTVSEGKYVYVRGLGDRYSQTSLNGSPLPSPEPEKEVVPLDLFPSGFLESLTTQKTYTPDLPGDFTGGSIALETRDYPAERSFKLSVSSSYNSESQFHDGFLSYAGGKRDFLGTDDGARDLPEAVADAIGGLRGDQSLRSLPASTLEQLGQAFQRQFTPSQGTTPLNRSISASYGQPVTLGERELGLFVGLNYSDNFRLRLGEIERKFTTNAFNPGVQNGDDPEANVDYAFDRGIRDVQVGAVGNATLRFNPFHKLRLATTFSRSAADEASDYSGINREDVSGEVQGDRLRFVARTLASAQLSGDHQALFGSTLEWRAVVAQASQEEPGLREALYVRQFGAPETSPMYLRNAGESGRYFFSDLVDDDYSGGLDWTQPLDVWGGGIASVKIGGAYRLRARDFAARRFNWDFRPNSITNLDQALNEGAIVGRVTGPGEFAITEVVEPGDIYTVDDERRAVYAMVDLPLTPRLRLIGGARAEVYDLALERRGELVVDRDQTDILPAVSMVYSLTDLMNLRAAYSRTLDRPEFRELAPFQFTEAASLRQVVGNENLDVARFQSFDLRWEWFPRPSEVLSVGGFLKTFEDPIEQVYYAAASSAYSFQNAVDGRLFGVELDLQQGLDVLADGLRDFSVSTNVALIDSEVNVVREGAFVPTNANRPLEGQSPFVVNTGLTYRHPEGLPEIGLFYNVFGKRLAAAGGSGVPDIYEMPRHQLDLTFSHALTSGLKFKIGAENLLGSDYRYEQSNNGITVVQRQYSPGTTLSIGLSVEN
ncbi:MAG: outer membrane beta-barrel protein [Gemmatimonas sp.]|nr:outer membrane beta-barrel protein [Gemmatimonas sp.]